jgi:hypothetical protein
MEPSYRDGTAASIAATPLDGRFAWSLRASLAPIAPENHRIQPDPTGATFLL